MSVRTCVAAIALLLLVPVQGQQADIRDHPVRRIGTWQADLARPLDERIGAAPPALVEYLTLDNLKQGYPQRPRAAVLEPAFVQDVKAAIRELPPSVWRLFGERLVGVYFVEELGGTGYTDAVKDSAGKDVAAYIVLDTAVLRPLAANAWATWKESSPFKPQPGWTLEARIEGDTGNDRRNAIQYILLHELGHVLSVGRQLHPPWDIAPKQVPARASYPFLEQSWTIDRSANRYAALADGGFPQRRNVAYYFGAKLAAADMVPTYEALEKTNFPTLYAATQPFDDFAESFASYVHVVLMRRPWQIVLSQDGKVVKTINHCWDEPRCAAKRRLLEEIVGR